MKILYITCSDEKEAKFIATELLERKLIACANFFPITSMYWWQGKIEEGGEIVLLAKTVSENVERVSEEIKKLHSYEIPCILTIDADANYEYSRWVTEQIEKNP